MKRLLPIVIIAALATTAVLAATSYSVKVNGKAASIATTEVNGKVFVEATAFAKAVGATASVDAKSKTLNVSVGAAQSGEVYGQGQAAGGEGVLGTTYTLHKSDVPLNFTLTGLEYSVGHVLLEGKDNLPPAGKKLLIVRGTIQNPNSSNRLLRGDVVRFQAVDSNNENIDSDGVAWDPKTRQQVEFSAKPAQKADVMWLLEVDSNASIPKLIVNDPGGKVIRYDLKGKIKGLPAPFADPASSDASKALDVVPATPGSFYPASRALDVQLDGVSFSDQPVNGKQLDAGQRFLVVTLSLRAVADRKVDDRWTGKLDDASGQRIGDDPDTCIAVAPRNSCLPADGIDPKGGQTVQLRLAYRVPTDVKPGALTFGWEDGRKYVFDVSNAK